MALFQIVILVCAFVACVASTALTSSNKIEILQRIQNNTDFETIGQFGSKIFIKHNATVNWMAARDICKSAGLEFATFADYSEFSFVYQNATAPSGLWISAIMKGAEQFRSDAFNWDADGSSIPQDINFHFFSDQWICLYFSPDHHTYNDFCLSGRHQSLCQLQLN